MRESKVKKSQVKHILRITFPEYEGRKFQVEERKTYHMQDYWDGGSRRYIKAVRIVNSRLQVASPIYEAQNPFRPQAHSEFEIPSDILLVEHCIFCGKDLGIRFILRDINEFEKFLKARIEKRVTLNFGIPFSRKGKPIGEYIRPDKLRKIA